MKVAKWIEDTKSVIAPYFDEVHEKLFAVQKELPKHLAAKLGEMKLKLCDQA